MAASKKQKLPGIRAARGTKPKAPNKTSKRARSVKKKKRASLGGFRAAVAVAFLAGMAVTFVFFWTLHETRGKPSPPPLAEGHRAAVPLRKPGRGVAGEQGRAMEALPPLERNKTAQPVRKREPLALPRTADASPETGLPVKETLPHPPEESSPHGSGDAQASPKGAEEMPYEETLADSLDKHSRHVEYALTQAALLLKLPVSNLRAVRSENRLHGAQAYRFQQFEILPGSSTRPFIAALRGTLNAWGGQARLSRIRENRWAIAVNGVQTHVLQFYPGHTSFTEGAASGEEARRTPGEPARLAIVIDDLGMGLSPVRQLLALDYPVTFAFWPHGANTREGALMAHEAGREILVHQPMEPLGYPKVRPGPGVLRVGMGTRRIRELVEENITRVPYAVGLNNHMGSRFTQDAGGVDAVLNVLRDNGLFALDSVTHAHTVFYERAGMSGVTAYRRGVFLDVEATKENVLEELKHAERIALLSGQAVAIGHPLPATLAALGEWQRLRDPSVRIIPLGKLRLPAGG